MSSVYGTQNGDPRMVGKDRALGVGTLQVTGWIRAKVVMVINFAEIVSKC